MLRKQIAETPIETLQKRNNVEATIFQLGFHYSNAKTRYRGENKHQMWANIRCLWINFVRILKYIKQLCQRAFYFVKYKPKSLLFRLNFAIKSFFAAILPVNLSRSVNIRFSMIWENRVIGADSLLKVCLNVNYYPQIYNYPRVRRQEDSSFASWSIGLCVGACECAVLCVGCSFSLFYLTAKLPLTLLSLPCW